MDSFTADCEMVEWVRLQVLANGSVGTLLSVGVAVMTGWGDACLDSRRAPLVTAMMAGVLGHYACCNGDTWSSEVGVLSKSPPRLITTFKASSTFSCLNLSRNSTLSNPSRIWHTFYYEVCPKLMSTHGSPLFSSFKLSRLATGPKFMTECMCQILCGLCEDIAMCIVKYLRWFWDCFIISDSASGDEWGRLSVGHGCRSCGRSVRRFGVCYGGVVFHSLRRAGLAIAVAGSSSGHTLWFAWKRTRFVSWSHCSVQWQLRCSEEGEVVFQRCLVYGCFIFSECVLLGF